MRPTINGRPLTPPRIEIPSTVQQIAAAFDLAAGLNVPLEAMLREIVRLKLILCMEQTS
jgi:hypothetical protein